MNVAAINTTQEASEQPVSDDQLIAGRYRKVRQLGAGGMSSVFLVRCTETQRLYAAKVMRHDLADRAEQRDRFVREANAISRAKHPNIVGIHDFGEDKNGTLFLVMEYVPGDPLFRLIAQGRLNNTLATDIALQITRALEKIHEVGVIHRDLKPDNVLLVMKPGERVLVKVVDFGIAKLIDAPPLTGSQHIFGTPGYIAPEYIQSVDIDLRSDFYSLGVILYEMVTGVLPFDYEYPTDLLAKHLREAPPMPRMKVPSIDRRLEAIIMRCLEKKPSKRFQNSQELIHALEEVQAALGLPPVQAEQTRRISTLYNGRNIAATVRNYLATNRRFRQAVEMSSPGATQSWPTSQPESRRPPSAELPTLAFIRSQDSAERSPRTLRRF